MTVVEVRGKRSLNLGVATHLDINAESCTKKSCKEGIQNLETEICTAPNCKDKADCNGYCDPNPESFCQNGICCCW